MKLIGAVTSPYVRKVRIVMAEKKLEYEFVQEDVWAASTSIVASNPLGKVPCLLMETGEALYDSRVIVEYLDTLSPVGKLIPPSGRERTEVKVWEALADGLLDAAIAARLEAHWVGRSEAERSQAWIDRQLGKVHDALAAISQGLADNSMCVCLHTCCCPPNPGISPWVVPWGIWIFVSPTSLGGVTIPTWTSCKKN